MTPIPLDRQNNSYGIKSNAAGPECPCPSVTINGPEALEFPEYCLVTFKVCRGQIVARSATRGQPASASVELKLKSIEDIEECDPDEIEQDAGDENESPIDKLFAATQKDQESDGSDGE